MSKHPIVNLDALSFAPRPAAFAATGAAAERFDSRSARVGALIGARLLGYNVTAVPPGKAAFPAHAHRVNEEMFFILEGEGELRVGAEVHAVRQGDFIACPPGGADSAHQLRNTGGVELRYLAVSTMLSPEVCEYPDSGKFGVYANFPAAPAGEPERFYFMGRPEQLLDYWDGEGLA